MVKILLEHELSSISKAERNTAAFLAFQKRDFEVLKLLLEHGAPANKPEYLTGAALAGHAEIVKLFLKKDASANGIRGGPNVLNQAVWNGHLDVVKVLLEHGAVISTATMNTPVAYPVNRTHAVYNEIRIVLNGYFNQQRRSRSTKGP
jgi:ankyrin repeat protein